MDYQGFFQSELQGLKEEGRYRVFADLERHRGHFPKATRHREDGTIQVTVWCSNDYLGMGQHPDVIEAMREAIDRCGAGAGGTRNISGTNHHHVSWSGTCRPARQGSALLFTSGYVSNWARCRRWARACRTAVILSDALNHASMIEGIRHSRAEKVIWKHNDPEDLDRKLAALDPANAQDRGLRIVYSMDGDIAPIKEICDVATSTAR
jgi:5-aminolevulinate synthase